MERPNESPAARRPMRALLRKPMRLIFVGLIGAFVVALLSVAIVALALTPTLPSIDILTEKRLKVPMRVYTQEGALIGEFGDEKRIPVKIEEMPPLLTKAILAAEDDSFYFHQGVDFLGIARATLMNLRSGHRAEGASTITMQVARNYFLSPEKTYTRKLKEVLLAFKMERELSKDQILELYLNKIFLGNRAYGFAAAAQIYYGKTLAELDLPEMAMLAGLPKAPSRDNPLNNPDSAKARRNYVLGRMHKLGVIDEREMQAAIESPVVASKRQQRFSVEAPYLAEMVRQYMFQTYDDKTYGSGFHVYTTISAKHQRAADLALRKGLLDYDRRHGYRGPLGRERIDAGTDQLHLDDILKDYQVIGDLLPAIVTNVEQQSARAYTQDGKAVELPWAGLAWARAHLDENSVGPEPKTAADVLRVGDVIYVQAAADGWHLAQPPKVAGALVSLRPSDGAILALTGGFDFYSSNFNRAMQAERQPGSSLKPFVYSAALEKGFTPASLISGAPIVVEDVNLEDEWRPEDYSGKFFGPTRLRKALTLSLNLVSVRLLRAIGPEYTVEYLGRFGFDTRRLPRNLSLALGTASVTPMQMARAFSVFANGGYRIEPWFIARVEDGDHKILEQHNPVVVCAECDGMDTLPVSRTAVAAPLRPAERVISAENAFLMTSMMKDVITAGTAQLAQQLNRRDIAGKTGTTNEHRDAWFCGFSPDVVATAWVGFDQNMPLGNGEVGGRAALPVWLDYMQTALDGVPERPLAAPEGVVMVTINTDTGRPTQADDPRAMQEFFMDGTIPGSGEITEDGAPPPAPPEAVREGLF